MMEAAALDCGDASRRSQSLRRKERWLAPPQSRAALLVFAILAATNAFATTSTSAITGRVLSGGVPATGVTVTVTSTALQGERTTVTTRNGRFWLTALPPGRYDVTFSRAKLQTLTRRVLVELSRVSRADAVLEPSEDEESITSTALPLTVADTTVINSHFSDETLDRLPMPRHPYSAAFISPGPIYGLYTFVNDAVALSGEMGVESLEQLTILRAALPADYEGAVVADVKTRSGGEDYFFSLRDTITSSDWISTDFPSFKAHDHGVEHNVELNAGGRIIKEKLWFFLGGWNGSETLYGDRTGYEAKLTWQAAPAHNLMLFLSEAQLTREFFSSDSTVAALRYTGTAGPRWTTEAVLSRATASRSPVLQPLPLPRFRSDFLFARTTYVTGDHILSAGGTATSNELDDTAAFFINDRWRIQRFTFNLGARHEHDELSPRLAAAFDVRGNGRQAVIASLSDYANPLESVREITLGFATAVGTTGSIRVDAFSRDHGQGEHRGAMGEFRYSLFDRFHTGASYTWLRTGPELGNIDSAHAANAWAGVDIPLGEHEVGITAMQHYRSAIAEAYDTSLQTDLALRYSLPVARIRLTLAADARNLFDHRADIFSLGRSFDGWLRLRL